ncbi:MAG TPA: class I SAM-dependent methyltransferase [Verrucomicrobiae bacterium]|nr:class I SAM-dependent methyltransferase [Verrucomicrobiae bacterium]
MSTIVHLSKPMTVHMAVEWFDIATANDFWIKRRFQVLRKLTRPLPISDFRVGEIGCGHGLVQQQFEKHFGIKVDGFDLNEAALRNSVAVSHARYCYNIFDRNPDFAGCYDLLVLFDVLEHIEQEQPFLEAVLFHLKPGGCLVINVPALMILFSRYDQVMGHQRRYTLKQLNRVCQQMGLQTLKASYWGLPFVPLLMLRRLWLAGQTDALAVTRRGYEPPGRLINALLTFGGALEPIPHPLFGTSVMGNYRKPATS